MAGVNDLTNRIAGIASITVNGQSYQLAAKAMYSPAIVDRETQSGQDAVHGFKEMPKAPFISMTLRDARSLSVAAFNAMTNANIILTLANGKTVTGSGMWCVGAQEVDTTEATFDVKFEGFTGSVVEN